MRKIQKKKPKPQPNKKTTLVLLPDFYSNRIAVKYFDA